MACSIYLTVSATALQIVSDHRQHVTKEVYLFVDNKRTSIKLRLSLYPYLLISTSAGLWRFEKPRLFEV